MSIYNFLSVCYLVHYVVVNVVTCQRYNNGSVTTTILLTTKIIIVLIIKAIIITHCYEKLLSIT